MNRIRVAIFFGGCSEEHDVSVKSAQEIAAHIDTDRYEPLYIGITRTGAWRLCERPCAEWEDGECLSTVLSPDREAHGLLVLGDYEYEICRVDVAFPVLHGTLGEDGALQGLFELSGIPYVGCDVQSSAICMDKSLAYVVARSAGIATPEFWVLGANDDVDDGVGDDVDDGVAAGALPYPVFVKPARSGSSFGVERVDAADGLRAAIASARRYDSKVLIEQAISGCEIGCAVLENGSELVVGELDQIRVSHGIFRIHQEDEPERGSENAVITIPAALSVEERSRIQETAKNVYRALGCRGLSRVDMFLMDDGRVVLNEVNTLPGFTSYSRYPRMMAAAGIALSELVDQLIISALER
jgi:D-alanine--(R)-lactate ligase